MEEITEPFRQARHGPQTRDGTGLCLPLSKAFIDLHGCRMSLESRLGLGTTVRVRLSAKLVLDYGAALPVAAPRQAAGS